MSMPRQDPTDTKGFVLAGACITAALLGTMILTDKMQPAVMKMLNLADRSPGGDPPWNYIRRDFADGICAVAALLISLAIAAIAWKRCRTFAEMAVWMGLLWHGGKIVKAAIIYANCPHFFDPALATSCWPTFDSYLDDANIKLGQKLVHGSTFGVVLIFALLNVRTARAARATAATKPVKL